MSAAQPLSEARQLAKDCDIEDVFERRCRAELIRLDAENEQLRADMAAIGAGGVGPLMKPANHVEQNLNMVQMPRPVVEQTLDALRSAKHRITEAGGTGWKLSAQGCTNSITALRTALEKPAVKGILHSRAAARREEPDEFYEWWCMRPSLTMLQAQLLWRDRCKQHQSAMTKSGAAP